MSRRLWRCRNAGCSAAHGAILGRVVGENEIVLDPAVTTFRVFLDSRKALVVCPCCGAGRYFRGRAVLSLA